MNIIHYINHLSNKVDNFSGDVGCIRYSTFLNAINFLTKIKHNFNLDDIYFSEYYEYGLVIIDIVTNKYFIGVEIGPTNYGFFVEDKNINKDVYMIENEYINNYRKLNNQINIINEFIA